MTVPSDLPLGHAKPCPTCGTCPTCGHRPQPYGVLPYSYPWWNQPTQPWWQQYPVITYQTSLGTTTSSTPEVAA